MRELKKGMVTLALAAALGAAPFTVFAEEEFVSSSADDPSGFVLLSDAVPDAILEIRYYSTYNFVGDRIAGYEEPLAFLTKEAAAALKEVSDDLVSRGYRLKIYDAYRPQMAVTNFVEWAEDTEDTRMKEYFYPELDKSVLFPQGYIAEKSGHSRGSTVDLTLFDMKLEKEVDMGGTFDYFGELSHPDFTEGISEQQYENRMILRDAMLSHGFKPLEEEWWHFTLEDEPYPDTYFTFPINSEAVADINTEEALLAAAAPKVRVDDSGRTYTGNEKDIASTDGTSFRVYEAEDGYWYDEDGLVYSALTDDVFASADGRSFSVNPEQEEPADNTSDNTTDSTSDNTVSEGSPLGGPFPVFRESGAVTQLTLYSDGYYYTAERVRYTDNGDGTYAGIDGSVLYDSDPVSAAESENN